VRLRLETDRRLIRAGARSTRYLVASVIAPTAPRREQRLPINVALVLDRSGSMEGSKLVLAREAVRRSLEALDANDRFSIVVYDNIVDVLSPSTPATSQAKSRALQALELTQARGTTDLGSGWLRGCEQVARFADGERVSRCLLLTDGLANVGIVDRQELARHADELRRRGVQTSTFGVGADFDERKLRDMAQAGSGNFYYIETAAQIPDLVTSELGEALEVVVRGAALELSLPPGATATPLQRFRHFFAGGDRELRVELGDLVSGQQMDVVIAIEFDSGILESEAIVEVTAVASATDAPTARAERRWTYASHTLNDAQPRERAVDRQVATLYAARARADAAELNRAGLFDRARELLSRTAKRIRGYAGTDPELNRIADELEAELHRFSEPMPAMEMKSTFFAAHAAMVERSPTGRAKR
jgi:Ca-activated chloride channel family protein